MDMQITAWDFKWYSSGYHFLRVEIKSTDSQTTYCLISNFFSKTHG